MFKMLCYRDVIIIIIASVFLTISSRVLTDCTARYSETGHVLENHVFKSLKVDDAFDCQEQCRNEIRCQSINYFSSGICELNDKTKDTHVKDFIEDATGFYFRSPHAEKLGTSRHNAPSSCGEIKRNHPEACSGSYWLDKNRSGKATQEICYMNSTYADVSSCKTMTASGSCCALPFVYLGVTYQSCTDKNTNPAKMWCSLQANYAGVWDYCVHCPTCSTKDGFCCVFPFRYKNKMFDTCTDFEVANGSYWCSLTSDYVGRWGYCA